MSLPLIEPLILEVKREYGSFDITGIPAIEEGAKLWAVINAKGQLKNLKELVEFFPELSPWKEIVNKAFIMNEMAINIWKFVSENPGVLQRNIRKSLGYDNGRLVSNVLYYLALLGFIHREKTGSTYKLFSTIN